MSSIFFLFKIIFKREIRLNRLGTSVPLYGLDG